MDAIIPTSKQPIPTPEQPNMTLHVEELFNMNEFEAMEKYDAMITNMTMEENKKNQEGELTHIVPVMMMKQFYVQVHIDLQEEIIVTLFLVLYFYF